MARVTGDNRPFTQLPLEMFRSVSPQYFSAIGLRLAAGKVFSEGDWGKNLALVSQKTAKSLWPGKDALGRNRPGKCGHREAVYRSGCCSGCADGLLAKPNPMLIIFPYWYRVEPIAGLVVRTHQDPSEMADVIRQTIWSVDRGVPVPTVRALGGVVEGLR